MLRRLNRRYRRLLLVVALLYLVTCTLLMTSLNTLDSGPVFQRFFERVFDPFGSITDRQCCIVPERDGDDVNDVRTRTRTLTFDTRSDVSSDAMCYWDDVKEWPTDIDMESVWDTVSVGYPSLVLTVTGWVEPVQVHSWTPKPLHVIIMPHSHQDPGWTDTLKGYFTSNTQRVLDLLLEKLDWYPTRRFVWTEVVFLDMWWNQASLQKRETFKKLLRNGQLELLTGGWVMTDESVAHYGAMLDQLTEGHLWINQTLGVTVHNGWAIDPFGHSSTMAYILGQSGIRHNVIQRAHFAVKRHLAATKSLEFYWKQIWDHHGNSRMLTHMMPFRLYGIPYSCGPDRTVCCKLDFHKKQCFHGNKNVEKLKVDETNVAELSADLWEQLQKKSELYRNNVLLVPHGDDFRFNTDDEWDLQFGYLTKIMRHINNSPDMNMKFGHLTKIMRHTNNSPAMNMKIEFGTLSDYFNAIDKPSDDAHEPDQPSDGPRETDDRYPTLSGDLFPYTDRGDQYWSGFYSVRPFYKRMVRTLQATLRSAEILFTFCLSKLSVDTNMGMLRANLDVARRGLALHQHHDAVTGTSREKVVRDYAIRLKKSMESAQIVYRESTLRLLQSHRGNYSQKQEPAGFNLTVSYPSYASLPVENTLKIGLSPTTVVVTNTLGFRRREVARVIVSRAHVVVSGEEGTVRHQISPVWTADHRVDNDKFLLSFEVDIDPFSIYTYTVQGIPASSDDSSVARIFNFTATQIDLVSVVHSYPFIISHVRRGTTMAFSNSYLTAHFSPCDGMLKSVHYHGDEAAQKSDVHFVVYTTGEHVHPFKDKSGAYTFIPDGPAKELKNGSPAILVTKGPLFTEIKAIYKDIIHTTTIYNVTGSQGLGVHIDNVVNLGSSRWDNKELVMRLETNVKDDQHSFCTDTNGFQLHQRKTRAKMTIQGNFYPLTTMAVLDTDTSRVSLLTASSHGVASLISGWLEVVLDRRLIQDDWRGLNENITDNLPTRSSFVIVFEKKTISSEKPKHNRLCLPSMTSDHLSESLNNPLALLFSPAAPPAWASRARVRLSTWFPCDMHMVNLRSLSTGSVRGGGHRGALLVLHRKGYDCEVVERKQDRCPAELRKLYVSALSHLRVTRLEETTLTGTHTKRHLDPSLSLDVPAMAMKTYKIGYT